jgi:Tripartite tricarboxylate transporter family receptor
MMAGVNMLHVPYRGEALALTDLLGGQVEVLFGTSAVLIENVRSGKLRALAVTTAMRSEALPEIPTVGTTASAHPGTRPRKSLTSSAGGSTRVLPIPGCRRG